MLRRRDAEPANFRIARVVNNGPEISVLKAGLHPFVEFDRPVERRRVIGKVNPPEVMNDIAASDDKGSFLPQVLELRSESEVEFRPLDHIETELKHRDIRRRVHM